MKRIKRPWLRRSTRIVVVAAALLTTVAASAADLPPRWERWLDEQVYPLITDEQRTTLEQLETEAQRTAFADRLWELWGRQLGLGPDAREVYRRRLEICRERFGRTTGDRAALLLLHGMPDSLMAPRCPRVFFPMEFWVWDHLDHIGNGVVVLVYQPNGVGPWRLWNRYEGFNVLYTPSARIQRTTRTSPIDAPENQCFNTDTIFRLLRAAESWGQTAMTLRSLQYLPQVEEADEASVSKRFSDFSAIVPGDAEPLDVAVVTENVEQQGGAVLVGFAVSVPSEHLVRADVGGREVVQVEVIGEIGADDDLIDRFRYVFTVAEPSSGLDLRFDRRLRPGFYRVRLVVDDVHSDRAGAAEVELECAPPASPEPPADPDPLDSNRPDADSRP